MKLTSDLNSASKPQTVFNRSLLLLVAVVVSTASLFVGCETETLVAIDGPPPAPQGVYTVRGDQSVTINWLPVEADDFSTYRVYWGSDSADGSPFELVGETVETFYVDNIDITNGTRYYYVVTAVDNALNESAQSAEWGGATPREERSMVMNVSNNFPASSGLDLSTGSVVAHNSQFADFWFDNDGSGNVFINADSIPDPDLGDVQDMGFTEDLDEIARAPQDGWSVLGYSEALEGHTYIIWTDTDNYAKIRIISVTVNSVFFEYAYQSGDAWAGGGEPELAPSVKSGATKTGGVDRSTGAHRTDTTVRTKSAIATSGIER